MKRFIPFACALALVSCSAPLPALSPDQTVMLRQTCLAAAPALSVAARAAPASVSETAGPADAYCRELNAGALPATTDANTPTWLPKVIAGVQVAAEVAKVALPLVLMLL